jgi:hypothetical protein
MITSAPEPADEPKVPVSPREPGPAKWIGKTLEAGASAVPFVGGPLAVVTATIFGYAYSKRVDQWRDELTATVQYLIDHHGLTAEDLADDDEFLDAVATATRIAAAPSSADKRRRLRNALINIGSGKAPEADKQAIYLRYIDELTPSHMRLLDFMNDPPDTANVTASPGRTS